MNRRPVIEAWAKAVFMLPASSYTFLSGILSSIAINNFTGNSPPQANYPLYWDIALTGAQVAAMSNSALLLAGSGVFSLGVLCEQAARVADFARSDHTTKAEYEAIGASFLISKAALCLLAISSAVLSFCALFFLSRLPAT